jgi:hypothetical protein
VRCYHFFYSPAPCVSLAALEDHSHPAWQRLKLEELLAAAICMEVGWLAPRGIQTVWLTGSQKTKERRDMLALIASGAVGLVIGTHAIIQVSGVVAGLGPAASRP